MHKNSFTKTVVLASANLGKLEEFSALFNSFHVNLIPQSEKNVAEIDETAPTFIENALLKARHATQMTGLPALADDSGLVVPILKGAPGIYSARYAGKKAGSAANIQKLLTELEPYENEERKAFFHCCLVFIKDQHDAIPLICEANWEGILLKKPRGENGFGYDPIFYIPSLQLSAAQLTLSVKNQLSHRGKAIAQLKEKLSEMF